MSQLNQQKRPRGEQGGVSSSRTEGATRISPDLSYRKDKGEAIKASGLEKESRFRRDKSFNNFSN